MGANIAIEKDRGNTIEVDPERCIACGACIDACEHSAREYVDDVEQFFADLKRGEKISVLIAPAFLLTGTFTSSFMPSSLLLILTVGVPGTSLFPSAA